MRILFLHTAYSEVTPEYKVHLNLVKHLAKEQVEALFIWQSPTPHHVTENERWQVITHDFGRNMFIEPQPSRAQRGLMLLKQYPSSVNLLKKSAKAFQPDLIYTSQQTHDMRYAKMLSKYLQVPHVIHAHYTIGEWLGKGVLKDIQKAKHLFTVSEFVRQNALLCGVTYENVHTIPNTVDYKGFPNIENPKQLLTEFGWQEDNQVILAVGRLDPGKGHDDLLRAFADVIKDVPEARVLICGTPSSNHGFEEELKHIAEELDIASLVHFAGYRTDIPKLVQCADLFCLPSIMEPFGLVYLEAMAAKLPVVAYYSGGVPEIVLHERTGLLSYPDNIPTLAENLTTLLKKPDYAKQLGQAGFERAIKEFNPDKVSAYWFSLLQRFLCN